MADIYIDISNRLMPPEKSALFHIFDANVEEIHRNTDYNPFFGKIQDTHQTINIQKLKTFPAIIYHCPQRPIKYTKSAEKKEL